MDAKERKALYKARRDEAKAERRASFETRTPNKKKPVETSWTTADGVELRICDMTDNHLMNAIKCIERNAEEFAERVAMNSEHYQGDYDFEPYDYPPEYDDLVKEWSGRGLDMDGKPI